MDNIVRVRRTTINKITFGLFLALTTQGYSQRVNAETAVESSHEHDLVLDELKVEGTSNAHEGDWVYDELHSVSEISREQLDSRPARHAADILEQTSGVYSSVSQQDPALSVNIRGMQDYGRVNMNIDGMRQNFMKSGHGQRNGVMYIDPEILNNVVIEKGVTSGIGGAGVIGGIATFNTINASNFLEPGKEIGGQIRVLTGDNGTNFIGSAALALGNEYGDILIAASERNLSDYWPGNKGNMGDIRFGTAAERFNYDLKNNKVEYTRYKMRSQLTKLGWNLPANQRLMLSYLQTQINSPNASMLTQIVDKADPYRIIKMGWKNSSVSDVLNRNIGLDYSLKPEHIAWLDVAVKVYYVDTDDETNTLCSDAIYCKKFWTQTRLTTRGLQLQNTSFFTYADHHQFHINYGLEWFSDRSRGNSTHETILGLTPPGKRTITSTFAQLNYDYDNWLRLEGGLRYDQFRLQGNTWMHSKNFRGNYTRENPCNQKTHEQYIINEGRRCSFNWPSKMTWEVDRREQQLSPTLAIGIKPGVQWLEFFGNYGKSWRPPAITEVLATGSAHGHSWTLPNPILAAEHSKAWEAGMNIQHSNLFIAEDRLVAKLAYFDTRVTDYINLELSKTKPLHGSGDFTNATYINNLLATHFRGLEYQLSYDAGVFYTNLNYTRMIGVNTICSKRAWLGGVNGIASNKNYEIYSIDRDDINNIVDCFAANNLFSSSAYLPGDRGSLTLGGRIFDKKLDLGTVIRYNKGRQDKSVLNNKGHVNTAYVADWPKYTIFDLYASYKMTNNLTLRSSIENITNRAYLISYGDSLSFAPNRGRTIQGGFEYKF
ncbi:TonB-dependent hemoglobin/transferrin/lactoferrin family receptor [Yersinia enterocolitica]|uniref:TonB-dependent hemoglobin/transferrin/lactoferrin family receptor n=1 Tax=Yersinia enterocolitica TaxID=630 RepID=UPI0002A53DAC|nr:TonB-dependent hemoglobin/transferrin/lactoferrin family receptor [Yersinia enterocolitica]AJJ25606.1 hasR protein [Yersinia enterocolitica]CRY21664.1 putative TonB dependent receptor protein [Yersinia enterocolitica]HDL8282364.1 TonB-dependent hemoglobin/transferrin/lactoferrin family receptor [Yersinia enterocolitica]HDL8434664.1 TonB-dependent hemoglobin/transferrin/lactoferrin family receptor [Yersinia enterocolitica]HDM8290184.1 TonB-dependent hemoglobin/transferrin/lactoferrin family 